MTNAPRDLAATVILHDADGRVLLVRQSHDRKAWLLPGGSLKEGETPRAAAEREAHEEIGVDVALGHLVGVYVVEGPEQRVEFVFEGAIEGGEPPRVLSDEIEELGWFGAEGLPSPIQEAARSAIGHADEGLRGMYDEATADASPPPQG